MKTLVKILFLLLIATINLYSQEVKKDTRDRMQLEDPYNFYDTENISKTDLLKAIEYLGMRIFKFDVPGNSESKTILILAREYKDGKEVNRDTIANFSNEYSYWDTGIPDPFVDFISEFTIYANTSENKSELQFELTSFVQRHTIELDKVSDEQFYLWRKYHKTHRKIDAEIPLMIFASSWVFPGDNIHRFCGVAELSENDPMTKELLDFSPHYIKFTLKVE
ncbi:MAG: hypothetical protein ACI9P5_004120 [Saprospiraceae bacterium]|jgi:hypothetical protein